MSERARVESGAARFPEGFTWGVATSSYQIEGAAEADGRSPSVWDAFCATTGKVFAGDTGAVACDHYGRMKEDVGLLRELGVGGYRFSVAWPRVVPDGLRGVNEAGLDFYDALVDELLAAGVEPLVTLYHWDMPLSAQHRGGWLNRDSADWFAWYAEAVVRRLSDRVSRWCTLNEPQVYINLGHGTGEHAPGLRLGHADRLRAAHHTLMAHGRAVRVIREHGGGGAEVGWSGAMHVGYPADGGAGAVEAARRHTFGIREKEGWHNAWFADPIVFGSYPEEGLRLFGGDAPRPEAGDMELIGEGVDYVGLNIYAGSRCRAGADGGVEVLDFPGTWPRTAFGWPVTPEALRWGPRFFAERYGKPVMVTENGMANLDWVGADGRCRDPQRVDFTRAYLRELARAVEDGVDVRGYYHWSLMDNFEWAKGYSMRFGLVHVDYGTLQRTPKESFWFYRDVIASGGAGLGAGMDGVAAAGSGRESA